MTFGERGGTFLLVAMSALSNSTGWYWTNGVTTVDVCNGRCIHCGQNHLVSAVFVLADTS